MTVRVQRLPRRRQPKEPHRLFWVVLAAPGIIWLTLLFIVPFYAMLAIAAGYVNPVFGYPVAAWNPLNWSSVNLSAAWRDLVGTGAFVGPIAVRTLVYVAASSLLSLPSPNATVSRGFFALRLLDESSAGGSVGRLDDPADARDREADPDDDV